MKKCKKSKVNKKKKKKKCKKKKNIKTQIIYRIFLQLLQRVMLMEIKIRVQILMIIISKDK